MRKWLENVCNWKSLSERKLYRVCIVKIHKSAKAIQVTLEHLDEEERGRITQVAVPRPIRPTGLAADFFKACGTDVMVGMQIAPLDCIGTTIKARFAKGSDGNWQATHFEPLTKENNNEC